MIYHGLLRYKAIKIVKRNNPREEKAKLLRQRPLPISKDHVPLSAKLGSQEAKIKREIAIMKKCRHSHVVRLIEVIDDKLEKKIFMGKSTVQI
jgi:SNF1-activating kinase 1